MSTMSHILLFAAVGVLGPIVAAAILTLFGYKPSVGSVAGEIVACIMTNEVISFVFLNAWSLDSLLIRHFLIMLGFSLWQQRSDAKKARVKL